MPAPQLSKKVMDKFRARAEEQARELFEQHQKEVEDILVDDLNSQEMDEVTEQNLALLEFGNLEVPAHQTKTRMDKLFSG